MVFTFRMNLSKIIQSIWLLNSFDFNNDTLDGRNEFHGTAQTAYQQLKNQNQIDHLKGINFQRSLLA